ncbi:MAG: hypothetical protein OXJ55_04720 [Caldilineaceae bacterium]|nr:hypothetical protein [Caldilineaceae bacterium]
MVTEEEALLLQPLDFLQRDLGRVTVQRMETVFLTSVQIAVGLQRSAIQQRSQDLFLYG